MTKLKYTFINEHHKRMHNALLRAGWTCKNDVKPTNTINYWNWVYSLNNNSIWFDNDDCHVRHRDINRNNLHLDENSFSEVADIIEAELKEKQPKDFSHINVGQWVRFIVNDVNKYPTTTFNKWYQRLDNSCSTEYSETTNESKYFWYKDDDLDIIYSRNIQAWDLTDIRDTNPDQPVQPNEVVNQPVETHEDIEYYPTTKDNIAEVLEYNDICLNGIEIKNDWVLMSIQNSDHMDKFCFKNPRWLELLELNLGIKLKPIPVPKFDFVQYLLDNGAKIKSGKECTLVELGNLKFVVYSNYVDLFGDKFSLTKENVKILIVMAKLSEELS